MKYSFIDRQLGFIFLGCVLVYRKNITNVHATLYDVFEKDMGGMWSQTLEMKVWGQGGEGPDAIRKICILHIAKLAPYRMQTYTYKPYN